MKQQAIDRIKEFGLHMQYHLGNGSDYFEYRKDKYNSETIRADLYNKYDTKLLSVLVVGGMTELNRTHQSVINEFETFVKDYPL